MCVQFMKLKSSHRFAPKAAFVPCGKCEECRQSNNSQWFFRLRSELDWCRRNNWYIGFFTLTYSDEHIPHLPESVIKNKWLIGKSTPLCFSRKHVRTFIDNIRKRLNETYHISGIKYMVCSEYGTDPAHTQRSHYHGLVCFPSVYEDIDTDTGEVIRRKFDPRDMFNLVHSQWSYGHVFPRYFTGGRDSSGYEHKPFLLAGDIAHAARYAAKYTCKDIGFIEAVAPYNIDFKHEDYKDCKPFHIQSKSIGLNFLSNKTSEELLQLLKHGESFLGDKYRRSLPLYIRNKVLFDPYYVFERTPAGDWWYDFELDKWCYKRGQGTHRRLVRKRATDFFVKNFREIFAMKVQYYSTLFSDMSKKSFWDNRGVPQDKQIDTSYWLLRSTPQQLAAMFLCYYGLPYDKCKAVDPAVFYLSRYVPEISHGQKTLPIRQDVYDFTHKVVGTFIEALKFSQPYDLARRAKAKRVGDFYKHAV